jgi:hypothetical protein
VHGTLQFSPTFWPDGGAIPRYFAFFKLVRHKWFANLINLRECAPYGKRATPRSAMVSPAANADWPWR